jgi:hypothetical protein
MKSMKISLQLFYKTKNMQNVQKSQNSFEEEWPVRSPRGLHKTEMESVDFIQIFTSVKLQKKK